MRKYISYIRVTGHIPGLPVKNCRTNQLSKDIYAKNTLTFAMNLRNSAFYFIAILVLLNGMTGGTVLHNTINTLTSADKAAFRSEIYCILGLLC